MASSKSMKLALIQMAGSADKAVNLKHAGDLVRQAVAKYSPKIVCLPEFFNAPYDTKLFRTFAETIPDGQTSKFLSSLAKELNVYIVGGSIPEIENNKLYNTVTFWGPCGKLVAKHRKVHLFEIDIPEITTFHESEALTAGNTLNMAKVDEANIAFGICFDIQFPHMWMKYREMGCNLLLIPSAFPMDYGDRYWETYLRARAIDTQSYVTMISPARDTTAGYVSHGYTMMVDPFGKVVASAKEGEEIVYVEIDFNLVEKARKEIKLFDLRRKDLFDLVLKTE